MWFLGQFIASGEFLNAFPAISGRGPVLPEMERRARGDPEDPGDPAKAQAPLPEPFQFVEIDVEARPASCGGSQNSKPPGGVA